MGPLDKFILADDSLTATAGGFDLKIHSHWYRSLPLSSLGNLQIKVNGKNISHEHIHIELDGATYSINQLPSLYQTWWFVLDPAVLHVKDNSQPVHKGNKYNVEVEMGLLIPYVLTGMDEKPLLASSVVSKTLNCN